MKYLPLLCFLLGPLTFGAPNKEILELSRDVANLQDQVRTIQRTLDENLSQLKLQTQQTLEAINKNNTAIAVMQGGITDRLNAQGSTLAAPVAGVNAKLDQMSGDFQALRSSVDDLTTRMNKLQVQLGDLMNLMKVMQSPPVAPAPAVGSPATGSTDTSTPPAGMQARQLYDAAQSDRSSGNFDLALRGFDQYLKYYGSTELAPNAQFYIGQIFYDKGDYPSAIKAFDTVLEKYSENNKTPDATYMKGMALWKSGQPTAAGREFLNVIQKYPKSEVAPKAKDARKALGLSVPSASGAPAKSAAKKKRK